MGYQHKLSQIPLIMLLLFGAFENNKCRDHKHIKGMSWAIVMQAWKWSMVVQL